jgi:hypothetical protein
MGKLGVESYTKVGIPSPHSGPNLGPLSGLVQCSRTLFI